MISLRRVITPYNLTLEFHDNFDQKLLEMQYIDECASILRNTSLNLNVNLIDMETVNKENKTKDEIDESSSQVPRF